MAQVTLGTFFSLNGVNLACVLNSLKISGKADVKKNTTLCQTAGHTYQKGLIERDLSGAGFFKTSQITAEDANGFFQTALGNLNSDYLFLFGREGSALGAIAEMGNLKEAKYEVNNEVGELVGVTFDAKTTKTDTAKDYETGVFLLDQTVTGSVNGSAYDGSAGSTGYLAQIHVLEGNGTAAVKIQHSTNGSTWADLFSTANYAVNSATQLSSLVASVNRYLRVVASPNGTTCRVAVAIKAGYTG